MRVWLGGFVFFLSLGVLAACGGGGGGGWGDDDDDGSNGAPDFGAGTGGVRDMSFARALVAQGKVPPADAFLVEAMFAEHDLPLTAPQPCTTLFCTKAGIGVAPDEAGESRAWFQVGLSSTIDPDTYVRPDLSLVFVVDVSGSMSWGYSNEYSGGDIAMALLVQLTSQMGANDEVAIVAFDDESYDVLATTGGDQDGAIEAALAEVEQTGGGGTSIEAGYARGVEIAEAIRSQAPASQEVRIVLITDAHPNVGETSPSIFQQMVADAGDANIGTTIFGVALGLDPTLFSAMAAERGGNAFTAMSTMDVSELMQDHWPWMFCPIAYDLRITARPAAGFDVKEAYGFPGDEPDPDEVTKTAATIFLSRRRGATLLEIAPNPAQAISSVNASVSVDYVDPAGTPFHDEIQAHYAGETLDSEGRWFSQPSVAKTSALALLVTAMHDAAEAYVNDHDAAVAILQPARDRFASDAAAIADGAIDPEIAFTDALLQLMENDAEQGTFYGEQ